MRPKNRKLFYLSEKSDFYHLPRNLPRPYESSGHFQFSHSKCRKNQADGGRESMFLGIVGMKALKRET